MFNKQAKCSSKSVTRDRYSIDLVQRSLTWFLYLYSHQIVSKYGRDSSVTEMLDKMDFVIMPVLNVDGYVFTWNPVCIHLFVSIYN